MATMLRTFMLAGVTAALMLSDAQAATVLSNATTEVVVHGGEFGDADPLIDYGGYFSYTDLATAEETTWSIDPVLIDAAGGVTPLSSLAAGGFGAATASGGGALSSATVGGVSVTALTSLSGTHATTTFTFTGAAGSLDGYTFLFYAENDIFGFADDVADFTGSIGGGDLVLRMYDSTAVSGGAPGLTVYTDAVVDLAGGATPLSFGSGIWTGFGDLLKVGDLSPLSADGSSYVTGPADLGVALAFTLAGDSATVVVDYYTTPGLPSDLTVPEPATVVLAGLGLLVLGWRRRNRR